MDYDFEQMRLEILSKNSKNIMKDIPKIPSLRNACILAKHSLASPSHGTAVENWLIEYYDSKRILSSEKKGDLKFHNQYNVEVKSSISKDGKKFNYVQLRPTHQIDFYLMPSYDMLNDNLFIFFVHQSEMKKMILKYGSYAHGTKEEKGLISENIDNQDVEFAIRPKIQKGKQWSELIHYQVELDDLKQKNKFEL